MRLRKFGMGLLIVAGLSLMMGCGKKEEPAATAPTAGAAGGTATPPPGIANQIKNNPSIPPEQRAKYGGK